MPLHLHYLPSVIPCLDSILEPLIRRHIGFKRRDSFRVFVPDAESRLDLEHRLVEQTELGQVLIGKSFLTLAGFAQLLLPWHPAPLPPASLPMQKKCLQLALNELHPEWRLDSAALQRCLRELHEIDRLRSLRSSRRNSPGLRLLATYENILESRGKSWTLPRLFREAWRLLPQAAAALLPEVTTCYWIGFHLPDENLLGLLETLKRIAPPLELHVFLPSRARVWGTEERLEAWRLRLENLAATLEEEAAGITRPRLEIQAFPTPIHEAEFWTRAWAEAFQQSRILTPSFGEAGERLQAQTAAVLFPQGTADALHGKDSSLIFQLLSVLAEGRDLETLADFCEVLEALQPLFGHLQDLAAKHDDADGLRLLEAYRRRLAEYAQAARLENEKRLWSEWLQELKEEWLQLDLPLALEIAKRLPWRRLDRAGLQQTEEIFIAGMNEGIYPASSPASSSRPDSLSTDFFGEESGYFLERHEADLALEQALYSAKQRAVLSYSNFSVAGRAMLPSSFLGELQEAVVLPLATALTLRLTADQAYFAENVARETRRLRHPEGALDRGGLDSLGLEADILQKLEKHPISAKYIDDYAACPWLFFAGRHLGLKEDIEEDLEIAPTRRGSWLHQILQETLQKFITSHFNNNRFPSIEELEAVLGPILGRLEAEMIAQKLPVPEILLRRQSRRLRAQVSEWLEAEQEVWKKAERKLFPRHLEWRFGNSPDSLLRYPLEPNLSIPFSGAVDRIDVSENGENYLLIDYKSSGSALLAKGIREGRRLQLWIYRQAVEQLLYPQKEALGGLYWDFKEMKRDQGMVRRQAYQAFVPKKIHAAAKSFLQDEEYEELETQLQNALQSILSKIVAGDYSLKPRECLGDSCSFSEICRYDSKPSR